MRLKGLKGFMYRDQRILTRKYRPHNVKMVIDANNLAEALLMQVEIRQRSDRFGMDLVAYGRTVEIFFISLRNCKIEPILVFDGAQRKDEVTSTTSKKANQIRVNIRCVKKVVEPKSGHRYGPHSIVRPLCLNMILKSIAIERQIEVVQCFYKADKYIAKMANDCDGFVLSPANDYLIFDVKRGVLFTDSMKIERKVKKQNGKKRSGVKIQYIHHLQCDLCNQAHFVKAFPGLDKSCLPLFAGIAGNDASAGKLQFLFDLVSPKTDADSVYKYGYNRIKILLDFLCNKSLEQCIDSLLALVEAERREEIEILIRNCIRYYDLPEEDKFDKEISKHYKRAFYQKYSEKFNVDSIDDRVEEEMRKLAGWLRKKMEKSNLSTDCLQLALRNICTLQPEMDDITKPSAHNCFMRYLSVLLALTRSSHDDNLPCLIYDREGSSVKRFELEPLLELENYGSIDYLIYDVCEDLSDDIVTTKLTQSQKTTILLATFRSSPAELMKSVAHYQKFLEPQQAEEFAILKLLMKYVELEEAVAFRPQFRESVLATHLYYLHFVDSAKPPVEKSVLYFLKKVRQWIRTNRLNVLNQWAISDYDITIVRNIVQMQTAIRAYEELNSFLGTSLRTLRMHKWLNSAFIYNYATKVEPDQLRKPLIVYDW